MLFGDDAEVVVESVCRCGSEVHIGVRGTADTAACPGCGVASCRVHDAYLRHPADVSLAGLPVQLALRVRRFVCEAAACSLRTFAEQIPGLTFRYGRCTLRLRALRERIGLALVGRAGARLTAAAGVPIGRRSLIRLVKSLPDPERPTPGVLGVDDFATRRGHRHSTVLTDHETHRVVEVLPGREAGPLARWLAEHPGVQIVCRDRAGAYAEGVRRGAPDAVQVADRYHLWANLGKAVEKEAAAHRDCLRAVTVPTADDTQTTESVEAVAAVLTGPFAERAREHHAMVHELLAAGHGIGAIAQHLGVGTAHRPALCTRRAMAGPGQRMAETA
ncbi:ISL3 family transposase [Catenulispora yoronensis]